MIPNDFDEVPCTDPDCQCWDEEPFDDYEEEDKWLEEYEEEPCPPDCGFCSGECYD
jgi:hypothetical protein